MKQHTRIRLVLSMLLGAILVLAVMPAWAVGPLYAEMRPGQPIVLLAGNADTPSRIPPPLTPPATRLNTPAATITVTYNGFSAQAQAAFQYAVDIWETQISSPVPIVVVANWTSLGTGILGSAGAHQYVRGFANAPDANTWYPIVLANKIAGYDLITGSGGQDIDANFNSSYSSWYFGTDGNTPSGKYDFVSVVLHELGHGLGFLGSMQYSSGTGSWGGGTIYPFKYDRFLVNGSNQSLINTTLFPNPSTALGQQLVGNNLFFNGTNAVAANSGVKPKLFAPASWQTGSSIAHLDESTYGVGNANSLMTPVLNSAEAIHDPGPITRGIFKDLGWTITDPVVPSQPDLQIRRSGETTYVGNGIYNVTASQTRTLDTGKSRAAVYEIKAENDGPGAAVMTITGTAGGSGWTVRYYTALTGGTEITSQVTGAGWTTPSLAVGSVQYLRVEVTPDQTVAVGSVKDVTVTATGPGTPGNTDTVLARTTRAPLTAVNLVANPASPKPVATRIVLTATPVGGTNVEFKFRVGYKEGTVWHWTVLRGYSTYPSSVWTPSEARTYTVQAWAREVGNTAAYQIIKSMSYVVKPPLSGVSLAATPASPRPVNTAITLSATPTGGASVEYLFRVGYSANGVWTWTVIRNYALSPLAAWTPTTARTYTVTVWAREKGVLIQYQAYKSITYQVTAN